MEDLDHLLGALRRAPAEYALDGLEAGVWRRIEAQRRTEATGSLVRVQLAVAAVTMIIGLAIGSVTVGRAPTHAPRPLVSYAEVGPWGTLQAGL